MRILAVRPESSGPVFARFDVRLSDDVRLNDFALRRNARGEVRCFPPRKAGVNFANIAPALAEQITTAAVAAYESAAAHESAQTD